MRQSSVSLNDCLQTGPSLTQRLHDVLLKFRIGIYAYTADISKAFLRVGLQEEDRNYTMFLWIKDPNNPNSELITYRFASVLFGATSSPFLLQATLDTHLKKSNSPNKMEISKNLYVNNFQETTNSEILVDSDGPRSEWPRGQIVSVHLDSQGILRIVKVKCRGNTTLKTLEKLVPLELPRKEDVQRLPQPYTPLRDIRSQRTAAQQCKLKFKRHYNSEGEE
ncbi:uncharacterized protein [Procambarus clarkii]|uniref:uncharacterized protein n=1 Tax=Procambarus clarkii TaxID=6728 RepID=UPI00374308A7